MGANVQQWDNPTAYSSQWHVSADRASTSYSYSLLGSFHNDSQPSARDGSNWIDDVFTFENRNSLLLLNVQGDSLESQANVQQWGTRKDRVLPPSAGWRFLLPSTQTIHVEDGPVYLIQNQHSGLYLAVADGSLAQEAGGNVVQVEFKDTFARELKHTNAQGGVVLVRAPGSAKPPFSRLGECLWRLKRVRLIYLHCTSA